MKTKILLALSLAISLNAQDLQTSVKEIISTNPIVLERLKNYNATKEDITSAQAGYYPKLDLSLGAGVEHNAGTKKDGTDRYTSDQEELSVYQNSLKYTQNIFKGWETTHLVEQSEYKTISAAYSYIEKVNDTSFEMVNTYLQVMKNKELLDTAKENVEINKEIFNKVQKLYDSGLTTLSEVNKIESSLALAESNYVVQENTLVDTTYNLQRVLGRYLEPTKMLKPTLNVALPKNIEEAAQFAMENNPSLLVGKYNIKLAQATYNESKSSFYPSVDIEVSQSMNKNLSAVEGEDNRFRAMAYLSYNFFNGFADSAALQKSISQVHQQVQSKNSLRRQVIEGLNLSWAANEKLGDQLVHLQEYKNFALKTLKLYAKEYDLGRRSLLDLLSAQNDFIGAKSQIINTEYSMLFAKYRILDAMGTLVPTVIGNEDIVYANVGLVGNTPENSDNLPIHYDNDNDLLTDDDDICNNSLSSEMKNIYGCSFFSEDVKRIERYSGFMFDDESAEISDETQEKIQNLIKQLNEYGFQNIKIDILGNIQNDSLTKEQLKTISLERAEAIKRILVEAGFIESNVFPHAKADHSPISSDESSDGISKNNRADIIVTKLKK